MRPSQRDSLLILAAVAALFAVGLSFSTASGPTGYVVLSDGSATPTPLPLAEFEILPPADSLYDPAYPPYGVPLSTPAASVTPSPTPSPSARPAGGGGGSYSGPSSSSAYDVTPTPAVAPTPLPSVPSGSLPSATPTATPAASPSPTVVPTVQPSVNPANPFSGARLYVDPRHPAKLQADAWRQSRPADAAELDKLWPHPVAIWFSGHEPDVRARADSLLDNATAQGQVPLIVIYSLPKRDCGGAAAGGFASPTAYRAYVEGIAAGLAGRKAIVVLEPDGTAATSCLDAAELATRWELMRHAIRVLKAQGAAVYVDAANPRWVGLTEMSRRLNELDISDADGFVLNLANFIHTPENVRYGMNLSARVGNKPFIIDTSRNGRGPHPDGIWCNPSGRGAGVPFTVPSQLPSVHALVWIKQPGWSDGSCRGGPGSGFYAPFALEHARNANFTLDLPVAVPTVVPLPSVPPLPTVPPLPSAVPVTGLMRVDAAAVTVPYVDRGVLGGNSLADRVADYAHPLFRELGGAGSPSGRNLNRPYFRMHLMNVGATKNQWFFDPDFRRRPNGLFNPMINESDPQFNWSIQYPEFHMDLRYPPKADGTPSDNHYQVEWYDRSPSFQFDFNRHAISYTKVPGSGLQPHRMFAFEPNESRTLPNQPTYTRLDFKLSSDTPFSIRQQALVFKGSAFELVLNPDRTLTARFGYPRFNHTVTSLAPLAFDRWYSVEILPDTTSQWWLDGQSQGQVGVPRTEPLPPVSSEVSAGTLASPVSAVPITEATQLADSYHFKIDEVLVQTTYSGPFPQAARQPVVWHRFDNNIPTLDDYGYIAERLNLEWVPQLPTPCEIQYGCATDTLKGFWRRYTSVEGMTAMFQYLVAPADADYAAKAEELARAGWPLSNLKAADGSGYYNYANLRAARGRVAPYVLRYMELGSEPYYEEYPRNEAGFARRFVDLCRSLKRIQPDIRCILPAQDSSVFSMNAMMAEVARLNAADLVSGLGVHDYFLVPGKNRLTDFPLRTMAGSYADPGRYNRAVAAAQRNFGSRANASDFAVWINEYNSILANYKFTPTDRFMDAAYDFSELAFMLERGVTAGGFFFWNSAAPGDRFVNGFVGDYPDGTHVNLNGQTFLAFSRYFGWGGRMVSVQYDPLIVHDAVSNLNMPRLTAVSSVSADGRTLYLAVVNRDALAHARTLQLEHFAPASTATVYALDAGGLQDSIREADYRLSSVAASSRMDYTFPGYSITFFRFDAAG